MKIFEWIPGRCIADFFDVGSKWVPPSAGAPIITAENKSDSLSKANVANLPPIPVKQLIPIYREMLVYRKAPYQSAEWKFMCGCIGGQIDGIKAGIKARHENGVAFTICGWSKRAVLRIKKGVQQE